MIIDSPSSKVFLDPMLPIPLLIVVGLALTALTLKVYLRERASIGLTRCSCLILFRLLGTAGLFLILLNPQRQISEPPEQLNKKVVVAIDSSASMAHTDNDATSRLDEALEIIHRSGLVTHKTPSLPGLNFFAFEESAYPLSHQALADLPATGDDTRIHRSLTSILQSAGKGEALAGVILLSDGHDFEFVNPARTALEARNRNCPIYAIPIGSDKPIRDAALRIASYQPYVFAGQYARIDAALRLIGCEYEDFTLSLYREGKLIDERKIAVGDELQRLESFQVNEDEPGQYAYELRLSSVRNEVTLENNSAITFLNVSNKKISLLILEGSPYWDTNFTQRTLWANDKFNIDAAVAIAPGKLQILRKDPTLGELQLPKTEYEFDAYDCVLLGKHVERILSKDAQAALVSYVQDLGGNVITIRGNPCSKEDSKLQAIAPVNWGATETGFADIEIGRSGRALAPFELLNLHAGQKELRPLLSIERNEPRELATVLAQTRVANAAEPEPTMVHRRAGRGQVLAIASTGLWRTGFHAHLLSDTSLFDRFWDNLILWIIAGRNTQSNEDYSVFLNTANLSLGQALHIRMTAGKPESLPAGVPIEIFDADGTEPIHRTVLASGDIASRLTASFTPEQPGIYRAEVPLPDGAIKTLRFAVYREDRESTEVSVDRQYLERIANMSGGGLITEDTLYPLVEELLRAADSEPRIHNEPAWSIAALAWLLAICFAIDWLSRRRWGLC